MIPLQLTLRNFLSYRETADLDMAGIHLACISGLNGAGKSSILDAMTWALFGKSRVKSDDDIVNRTAAARGEAAEVVFAFELEGAIYRIIRRKTAGKSAELEFQARAGERWQVLTESRMRETQAAIEKLLRMNYDVFTNASFLLQGKADEFTTKTPDKRKEVLADILGLSRWDDYKDLATEQRKAAESDGASVERQLAEIDSELAQEEELTRAMELAEMEVRAATAERDLQESLVATARGNKAMADQQRELLRRADAQRREAETDLQRLETTITQRRAELDGYQDVIGRRAQIDADFRAWQTADAAFTQWQEKAEASAAITGRMHPLEMTIARAQTQLEQHVRELDGRRQGAEKAELEVKELAAALDKNRAQLAELQARAATVAGEEQAYREAQARLTELAHQHEVWRMERVQLETRAAEIATNESGLVNTQASIEATRAKLDVLESRTAELVEARETLADKNVALAGVRAEQTQIAAEGTRINERREKLSASDEPTCPFCGEPLAPERRVELVQQLESESEEMRGKYRANRDMIATLEAEIADIELMLKRNNTVEKDRDTQRAGLTRYETQLQNFESRLAALREGNEPERLAELARLLDDDDEQAEMAARVEQFKAAADIARQLANQMRGVEAQIARDETRCEQLTQALADWREAGLPALAEAQRRLAAADFAPEERAALAGLRANLDAIGHDPQQLEAAKAERVRLAAAPQAHQKLLQAEAAVKPLADGLADMEARREQLVARIAELTTQRDETQAAVAQLEAGIGDLPAAEAALIRLRERVIGLIRAAGAARQRVDVLATRREDRRTLTAERQAIARRVSLLRQLEEACGRKGVQAMLIEMALPEIEDYANQLLDRLTSGDMRVTFETQRAAKTKADSLIETLDIKISDSSGERPYENYSGGEKFRINFAVRLALSQVLARRAGARLQTLVIDEGFGSQDPEGRQRLVEAINAVQDKFACILVITHIDELRDKFPARIDVEKTAAGSTVSVVAI